MLLKAIKEFKELFLQNTKNKPIHIISHFDTDGITSAAIILKTLEKLGYQFTLKIIKQLDEKEITKMPEDKIIFLTDLGSGSLKELGSLKNKIFIIDHHEINEDIPENIKIVNPHLIKGEDLCSAELTYLFSKEISNENKNLSHLAILGMIGDTLEKEINKIRNQIIKDSDVKIKRGLLLYPSTRPINKTLEFSPKPFIPGITGNPKGIYELLQDIGIGKIGKTYKPLIDLTEEEMKNLTTALLLRTEAKKINEYFGDLYLIKMFNKIEDAREISAIINACSRMDHSYLGLMLCLENQDSRKKAERVYLKYRQKLISGLKYIEENKIHGKQYVLVNGKDKIKDTIIGTLASILSFSRLYEEGTIIIAMAYNKDKIKVSTRISGRNPNQRNLKELMNSITNTIGGISGGHKNAAGCVINKENEDKFLELIKRKLELGFIKIT